MDLLSVSNLHLHSLPFETYKHMINYSIAIHTHDQGVTLIVTHIAEDVTLHITTPETAQIQIISCSDNNNIIYNSKSTISSNVNNGNLIYDKLQCDCHGFVYTYFYELYK